MTDATATQPTGTSLSDAHASAARGRAPAREERLKARLLDRLAESLAAQGVRRIALYGAGQHTRPIVRQPWMFHGIEVIAILEDGAGDGGVPGTRHREIEGVPVVSPEALAANPRGVQRVVISSEAHEIPMLARAAELFGPLGIEAEPMYWAAEETDERVRERLTRLGTVERRWIDWLIENRGERHDATLPMLHPSRTELHRRRYELAAGIFREAGVRGRVGDLASGTGYGTRVLAERTGCEAIGVELDPDAVDFARERHGGRGISFVAADATSTGLIAGSLGAIASFETVEHVADAAGMVDEFARLLAADGLLVISTPNGMGPTPFHVHDFGFSSFGDLISRRFVVERWLGQLPDDRVHGPGLPAGIFGLDAGWAAAGRWDTLQGRPDFLIAVARRLG